MSRRLPSWPFQLGPENTLQKLFVEVNCERAGLTSNH
jgi:hypothetical protein